MLLRSHVARALRAYFSASSSVVVGSLDAPIQFRELRGEADYRSRLSAFYADSSDGTAWLTPSEIFGDAYAAAIAKSLVARNGDASTLDIVEVGAGNGTFGAALVRYVLENHPHLQVSYATYEPSAYLRERQSEALHGLDAQVRVSSSLLPAEGDGDVHVVALEVLDNLPHDLVRRDDEGVLEAHVSDAGKVEYARLADPAIRFCLDALGGDDFGSFEAQPPAGRPLAFLGSMLESMVGRRQKTAAYVPTGAYMLLSDVCAAFPRHTLTLGDFDWLPTRADEVNAPIVQSGPNDYGSDIFAAPAGSADIMFPTHFESIGAIHAALRGSKGRTDFAVVKSSAFMAEHADLELTATRSGYNPIVEDFINTSFLLTF